MPMPMPMILMRNSGHQKNLIINASNQPILMSNDDNEITEILLKLHKNKNLQCEKKIQTETEMKMENQKT